MQETVYKVGTRVERKTTAPSVGFSARVDMRCVNSNKRGGGHWAWVGASKSHVRWKVGVGVRFRVSAHWTAREKSQGHLDLKGRPAGAPG